MHDLLFAHQEALTPLDLRRYADDLGLNIESFSEDLRQHRHAPRVSADMASADASGISGTPTFFVNRRPHHNVYDVAALTAAVRSARAATPIPTRDGRVCRSREFRIGSATKKPHRYRQRDDGDGRDDETRGF